MPDFTACVNGQCPKRKTCFRFNTEWGRRQSISYFPTPLGDEQCEFWMAEEPFDKVVPPAEAHDRAWRYADEWGPQEGSAQSL